MNANIMNLLVDQLVANKDTTMGLVQKMVNQIEMITQHMALLSNSVSELAKKENRGTSQLMELMTKNRTILADLVAAFYDSKELTIDMSKQMKVMTQNQENLSKSVSELKETSREMPQLMTNIHTIQDGLIDEWKKSKETSPDMREFMTMTTNNFANLAKLVKESRGPPHYMKTARRYDGRTNIEMWLLEMQQNLLLFPPTATEMQKVDFMKAYMTGEVLHVLGGARFASVDDLCKRMRDIYRIRYRIDPQGEDEPTDQFLIRLSIAVRQKFDKYIEDNPNIIAKNIPKYMFDMGRPDLVRYILQYSGEFWRKQQENQRNLLNRN